MKSRVRKAWVFLTITVFKAIHCYFRAIVALVSTSALTLSKQIGKVI